MTISDKNIPLSASIMSSKILSLSLLCLAIMANPGKAENILENFLGEKLEGYSNWIKTSNFDPSLPISGPTDISNNGFSINLDCYLSNHVVQDHSNGINITSIKANLESVIVSFTIQENVTFSGSYIANGTAGFFEPVSVKGDGAWHLSLPQITLKNLHFNYTISSAGFMQITSYDFSGVVMPNWYEIEDEADVYFENLWEEEEVAEYKDDIQDALYSSFKDYLIKDMEHPLKQLYLQYFQKVFAETKWTDIILTTPPPTCTNETITTRATTTTSPPTTTTLPTTTSSSPTTTSSSPTTTSQSTTRKEETTPQSENILKTFVREKLEKYPTWLRENQLDPSPLVTGPTYINSSILFARVECFLSNHAVQDHSQGLNFTAIKADLETISVSFEIQENVTFSGKYAANGTAGFQAIEFYGEGDWHIKFPGMSFQNIYFNYTISETGHVQITNYDFMGLQLPSYYSREAEVYFQDLWEDEEVAEEAEHIQDALYDGFSAYLRGNTENGVHPIKRLYIQYFEEIFANTTWAQIIIPGCPQPSTTTTDDTTTTTTETTTRSTTVPSTRTPLSDNASTQSVSVLLVVVMVMICTLKSF